MRISRVPKEYEIIMRFTEPEFLAVKTGIRYALEKSSKIRKSNTIKKTLIEIYAIMKKSESSTTVEEIIPDPDLVDYLS